MAARPHRSAPSHPRARGLGVVYGDIGTSPLYALRECFAGPHAVEPTAANVLGVLSLTTWSLIVVVLGQVPRAHLTRGQPGRGRHPRADGTGRASGNDAPAVLRSRPARTLRGGAPLLGYGRTHARHPRASAPPRAYVDVTLAPYVIPLTVAILAGSVRIAAPGHCRHRRALRARHRRVVWLPGGSRRGRAGASPRDAHRGEPRACGALLRREWRPGLPRAGIGGAGGHRRRGALRGHGTLRPAAHPARLVHGGPARPAPQLLRPGRDAAPRPHPSRQIPSSIWRRRGPSSRWWRWPPRRPSSRPRP